MSYTVRPAAGHNPWLVKPYPGRGSIIAGVTIHATRSGAIEAEHDDGPGTENWGMHPANRSPNGYWGTYWDRLIWRDGTTLLCTDVEREYASWTAGYGGPGTWALGHHYVQIEVSQSRPSQSYSIESIDSLAQEVAALAHRFNFPIVRIPFVAQTENPIPRGITTHEDSANGRKLGKSDPGVVFPWADFLTRAHGYLDALDGGQDMTEDQVRAIIAEWSHSDDFKEAVRTVLKEDGLQADGLPTWARGYDAFAKRFAAAADAFDLAKVPGE